MLNDQEKNALLHFVSVLNDNRLKSLASSITNGRINPKSREDATSCLLLHSESLSSLMNNKKITATILLNYLHHLKVPTPGNADKDALLENIFSIWKLPSPNVFSSKPSNVSAQSTFPCSNFNLNSETTMSCTNVPGNNFLNMTGVSVNNQVPTNPHNNLSNLHHLQQPMNSFSQFNSENMQSVTTASFANSGQLPPLQYSGQNMNQQHPLPSHNSLQLYNNPPKNTTSPYSEVIASHQLLKEVNSLAFDDFMVNFAKMFYELLNSSAAEYLHGLNRSHFFDECKMIIQIKGGEEEIEQTGESVIDVLKLLSDLKREHQLVFNPNLTAEGVRGKTDSHGLIYAVASGTLHHGRGQLVGVYEQSFILRKDPFEQNSCKIADSTLILRSSSSVNSFSQLLLPMNKKSNERNFAIDNAPSSNHLQITYHS